MKKFRSINWGFTYESKALYFKKRIMYEQI